jgi:histidyl-tRNA synthetase
LLNFYENKKHILTEESKENLKIDPILVLKSKSEDEVILNSSAPIFVQKFLKKDSKEHYTKFKEYLDILEIPYREDNSLVFKKSYETNSIWQFKSID